MKFLSAPWRWDFISGRFRGDGCVFCRALAEDDRHSLVCFRGKKFFVLLNKFPYSTGHLMVAPKAHVATPADLSADELREMCALTNRSLAILRGCFHAEGFNIGMNIGQAAGAGIKEHFHQHVVPRWTGDANFMATVGGTRVMSYGLDEVLAAVRAAFSG